MDPNPPEVTLEVSSSCNLSCTMCLRADPTWKRRKKNLSLAEFAKLREEHFSHPHRLEICGHSEPLLNPDVWKMAALESQRGNAVNVITNGLLLDDRNIDELLDSGLRPHSFAARCRLS